MMRMYITLLLTVVATQCNEEPRRAVSPDPRPAPRVTENRVEPARGEKSPVKVDYPGGQVTCGGGVIRSVGIGKAGGGGPRDALMAKRAAYLVAVRNAGLFMSGLRVDDKGCTRDCGQRIQVTEVRVGDFREVDSTFDPATKTAKVTIEIKAGK